MTSSLVTALYLAATLLASAPQPAILFEHRTEGPEQEAIAFSVAVFADGTVVFVGRNNTAISGEARTKIPPEKADRWIRALVDTGALDLREPAAYEPPPGSDWSRLTVAADGKSNTYRFSHWNKANAFVHVLDLLLSELDVLNRWVRKTE